MIQVLRYIGSLGMGLGLAGFRVAHGGLQGLIQGFIRVAGVWGVALLDFCCSICKGFRIQA